MNAPRETQAALSPSSKFSRLSGAFSLLGLIPNALSLAFVAGLVLRREGAPLSALLVASLLVGLPVLGTWALLGRQRWALALSLWLWPLALLWGSPQLFPGERGAALAEGLSWLAAPFGRTAAERAGDAGATLASLFGDDPAWERPRVVTPRPTTQNNPPSSAFPTLPPVGGLILPFEGGGDSLRVRTTFDGPSYSEELALLFDTGATLTTLDRGALRSLGLEVSSDAPTARFQTANGEVESPLVLLDRVWLNEDVTVEGVTVAVCDDCTRTGGAGLLGLNVTGLFLTTVDHELQTITLEPRSSRPDRRLDLLHWLTIEASATTWPGGRVEVDIALTNRSRRHVDEAVVEVACPDSSFTVTLQDINAGASRSTRVELPRGSACPSYRVLVQSGYW